MAVTINSRTLNFVDANVKIRMPHPTTGKVTVFTGDQIENDSNLVTQLGSIMAPDANTVTALKTGYVKSGNVVQAVGGGDYGPNYEGKEIDYETTDYNGNFFTDTTD